MTLPTLYHCANARSLRCVWAAEEAGIEYDLRTLPFPPRVHAPDYKAVNPLGTVPAWVEGDGLMTESAAICQRIARGTPLELTIDEPDYWTWLNWLHRSDATLTFPLAVRLRYTALEPRERRLPQAAEDYAGFFAGRARSVEAALADDRAFLVANRFTIADVCIGYALHLADITGAAALLGPKSLDWLAQLRARAAFIRALEFRSETGNFDG